MGIFTYIKIGISLVLILGAIGIVMYVKGLEKEVEIQRKNNAKLEVSIEIQKAVIERKREEYIKIGSINKKLTNLTRKQNIKINELTTKFNQTLNGEKRDFGKLAFAKPGLIQKIVNSSTKNVIRCMELLTGAIPKKGEKNGQCQDTIDEYFIKNIE